METKKTIIEPGKPAEVVALTAEELAARQADTTAAAADEAVRQALEQTWETATNGIEAIRLKAHDVLAGTDTFTPAQLQKIVAALVLRAR